MKFLNLNTKNIFKCLLLIFSFIFFTKSQTIASSGSPGGTGIDNPLTGINTIPELISTILSAVIGLIGVLAVASLVYGGILYMTSGGNEEQSNKGKKVLLYSVMGLIVSILSYVIVSTVIGIIEG